MRILIHDYAGHPFQVQLSRELARRGHQVLHLYYGHNNTPKGNLASTESDPSSLSIEAVYTRQPIQKYAYLKRWLQDLEYGSLLANRIKGFEPEVVLSANTPLDAQNKIADACRSIDSMFIFWLQDVSGLAAYRLLKHKIPVVGSWIGQYHLNLERRLLRQSHRIILIANDFRPILEEWGIDKNKLAVIPNWAPLDEVPCRPKENNWSKANHLFDKFVFLYTGGLGLKHNPDLLLQLSLHYREYKFVRIVVISEGPGSQWLTEKRDLFKLENLILMGYQPFNIMPDVLGSGDVLLAILEPDAGEFSVPSKVLTYLCANRPLLLAVPEQNLASKIVVEFKTGLVVPPHDVKTFLRKADELLEFA